MRPVHFVAVNYHGAQAITPFLNSLRHQASDRWELTVVDNSCNSDELTELVRLTQNDKNMSVLAAAENLGYFGAARWALEHEPDSDWVVVCNIDLRLKRNFVDELLLTDGGQYVTAPAITHWPGGYQQNPFMTVRPLARSMRRRALVFNWHTTARLYAHLSSMRKRNTAPAVQGRYIYAPHGSIMALHRRFFHAGGTLDHAPFLFGEEIMIGEQVDRMGGRVWFEPRLQVVHEASQATGAESGKTIWRMQRDAIRHSYRLIRDA